MALDRLRPRVRGGTRPLHLAARRVGRPWICRSGFRVPSERQGDRRRANLDEADIANQRADVRFVTDWLVGGTSPLAGRIDSSAVAVAGHSDGAETALAAATTPAAAGEPRYRAAIVLGAQPVPAAAGRKPPDPGRPGRHRHDQPSLLRRGDLPVGRAPEVFAGHARRRAPGAARRRERLAGRPRSRHRSVPRRLPGRRRTAGRHRFSGRPLFGPERERWLSI
jgi:hypothetical protein